MKSAQNRLIMLGLVCQGLTWDTWLLPFFYFLLWLAALTLPRRPLRLPGLVEALALVAGSLAATVIGQAWDRNTHFAIGHGLACIQLVRLLRPLDLREQKFSLLIACFHLAVGCTFLLDYRFLLILCATLVWLPRSLLELEAASFVTVTPSVSPGNPEAYRSSVSAWGFGCIGLIMLGFFLVFPRGLIPAQFRIPMGRVGSEGSLLDAVLDPRLGGRAQSGRILFQVQAESLGYLRCHALTEFDGRTWQSAPRSWRPWQSRHGQKHQSVQYRRVQVKNPLLLGRVLPVDGPVVHLQGNFFDRPFESGHGMVTAETWWKTAHNHYEYWILTNAVPEILPQRFQTALTRHPPVSPRLQSWLQKRLGSIENSYERARYLERMFQLEFSYELGAPSLSRLSPLEDFLFNQRSGHCERFASALALLLRMNGIPTRVILGYLPHGRNWISGWHDIRARDAHAWTEAWFPDRGWVLFDGTPAATLSEPPAWLDWLEELDSAWYGYVIGFDAASQSELATVVISSLGQSLQGLRLHARTAMVVGLGVVIILSGWTIIRCNRGDRGGAGERGTSQVYANHAYGRMLRALAREQVLRQPSQTPLEFLAILPEHFRDAQSDIELVTRAFCEAKYGRQELSPDRLRAVDDALKRILSRRAPKPTRP
ncbi:MAG TPA: transglutaminase domain-containing protein [Candidatus Paceibacterota bacterium]|nr:transglutaminase domain-containing protein [Verrucomicrobiota bacterium]HRY46885.1 transglutaminase domain-containing protein [Candidatus Paceibacterota bacterium]